MTQIKYTVNGILNARGVLRINNSTNWKLEDKEARRVIKEALFPNKVTIKNEGKGGLFVVKTIN